MKKAFVIFCFVFSFLAFYFCFRNQMNTDYISVEQVLSPIEIVLDNHEIFKIKNLDAFEPDYTSHNKDLAKKFNISEDEAFIIGNLGKYWTKNLIVGKPLRIADNDLIYENFSYKIKFENSPYCINNEHTNRFEYEKLLNSIRKGKFVIVNLDDDSVYSISKENRAKVKNFIVVRKNHVKNLVQNKVFQTSNSTYKMPIGKYKPKLDLGNIKIIVSDSTSKLYPDRQCSSEICKEILDGINSAQKTIDIAIYGYSSTPEIEKAIQKAISRGVKIRLIYDLDSSNKNIYPNTSEFVKLIPNNISDKVSPEANNTMHNKFYIFDDKKVITGSANLSHTDMSGYNSNVIIVINSERTAKIYKQEFEQMFDGKFHNSKISFPNKTDNDIEIYFSPQDKAITNAILPLLNNAKRYIYIPSFIISEKRFVQALKGAKAKGVDVKIIVDALNASNNYSKHTALRQTGIPVKTENYAGKMHSKSIIIDDEIVVIGSMNFSNSGENKNDENMVILKNSQAAKFYKEFFLYQWSRIPDKWLQYNVRAEGIDSIGSCSDGIDNNYDGKTDNDDPACKQINKI